MAIATRATEQLMEDIQARDPEVLAWLDANGFVSERSQQMQAEMDEILERVLSDELLTRDERQAMTDRLLDIQEELLGVTQRYRESIGKGLLGMGRGIAE